MVARSRRPSGSFQASGHGGWLGLSPGGFREPPRRPAPEMGLQGTGPRPPGAAPAPAGRGARGEAPAAGKPRGGGSVAEHEVLGDTRGASGPSFAHPAFPSPWDTDPRIPTGSVGLFQSPGWPRRRLGGASYLQCDLMSSGDLEAKLPAARCLEEVLDRSSRSSAGSSERRDLRSRISS